MQRVRRVAAILVLAIALGRPILAAPLPPADLPAEFMRGTVAAETGGGYARILVVFDRPTTVSASVSGRVLTVKAGKPLDADIVLLTQRLGNYVSSIRRDTDGLTLHFSLGVPLRLHTSVQGGRTAIDLVPESYAGDPPALGDAAQPHVATAPPIAMLPVTPEQSPSAMQVAGAATATIEGNNAVLRFPQARGHGIAVFTRGETMWIVLDGHPTLETTTLFANLASLVLRAEAIEAEGAFVIRMRLTMPLVATVSEDAAALSVTLSTSGTPPSAAAFMPSGTGAASALRVQLAGAARSLTLTDPEAGDRIVVVPGRPGSGVGAPRRMVELEALPSIAGVAIIPLADDLDVSTANGAVEISRREGLSLSLVRAVAKPTPPT